MPEASINGKDKWLHSTYHAGCNYLFLPLIPAIGTHVLILSFVNDFQSVLRYRLNPVFTNIIIWHKMLTFIPLWVKAVGPKLVVGNCCAISILIFCNYGKDRWFISLIAMRYSEAAEVWLYVFILYGAHRDFCCRYICSWWAYLLGSPLTAFNDTLWMCYFLTSMALQEWGGMLLSQ